MTDRQRNRIRYERRRKHPCKRTGCAGKATKRGGYCSYACRNKSVWSATEMLQRLEQVNARRYASYKQNMQRMLQRVKVMAQTEDARLILAWQYGKDAAKVERYRARLSA